MARKSDQTKRSRLVPDLGPWMAVVTLTLLLAACGGRPTPLTGDDAGYPEPDLHTPPTIPPTIPPSGCVVAIRIDDCCTSPYPAPAQMVAQDPCLVPYPAPSPLPQACAAKWPKQCAAVKCSFAPPISRLATPVPGGTCAWKSECNTAADCRLAYDARRCCDCPKPWPLELVQSEVCIHDYLINGPPPKHCTAHCLGSDCLPCTGPPKSECLPSGTPGINTCTASSAP
jgi:hypothetical protein